MTIEYKLLKAQLRPTILKYAVFRMLDGYHVLFLVHHTDYIYVCTCDIYSSSSKCEQIIHTWYLVSQAELCKALVRQGAKPGGGGHWLTRASGLYVLNVLLYHCCCIVRLRAPTTDALHVAGVLSLACSWRSTHVVVAAAFLPCLACWDRAFNRLQLRTYLGRQTITMV